MNWLTNFVRPKLQATVNKKKNVPEDLWGQCSNCEQMIFHRDLTKNLHVCHHCKYHMRIDAKKRLKYLFDDGRYSRVTLTETVTDPLHFHDVKKYTERLREARKKTGEDDAIIIAEGKIKGQDVIVAVFNFSFMGGSMGIAVGEAIVIGTNLSVNRGLPFIVMTASGGARMQEGVLSLMQMPRTIIAIEKVKEAGLPYIVVLTDPTTGGVSASFAMLGDIAIAEPGAIIGFAGARVIKETIREELPKGFQRSNYLLDHGIIDIIVKRKDLPATLARVLNLILKKKIKSYYDVTPTRLPSIAS